MFWVLCLHLVTSVFWFFSLCFEFSQSDQNRRCPHERNLCILGYPKCGRWRFLSDCTNSQWSDSWLVAHVRRHVFSYGSTDDGQHCSKRKQLIRQYILVILSETVFGIYETLQDFLQKPTLTRGTSLSADISLVTTTMTYWYTSSMCKMITLVYLCLMDMHSSLKLFIYLFFIFIQHYIQTLRENVLEHQTNKIMIFTKSSCKCPKTWV